MPVLTLTANPPVAAKRRIVRALVALNDDTVGRSNRREIAVLVHDPRTRRLVAGMHGVTGFGWMFVDNLWVDEPLRRAGWGTRIMDAAEAEAARRGCHSVWLDTFSWQARGFYEKRGYRVVATLPDYPRPHQRLVLVKALAAAAIGAVTGGAPSRRRAR